MTPTVQYCAPAPAYSLAAPEPVFHKPGNHPVAAAMGSDGEMVSPYGISFDDYTRMQTFTKRPTPRRKPVPLYATDPDSMRRVLVRFMEIRAFGAKLECRRGPLPGSDAYRLRRAYMKLMDDIPRLDALATTLSHRYVEGKQNGMSAAVLRSLEIEIEGVDSLSIVAARTPEIILGVIYQSYCCHEDSVTVAERFGLKPPSVRALLYRIGRTWARMLVENALPGAVGRLPKESTERLQQRRATSAKWYSGLSETARADRMKRNVARRRERRTSVTGA
jgi:hypothetical protein